MVQNDTKGWYGSFSSVGRNSAEKYAVIINRNKPPPKKFIVKSIFAPDSEEEFESDETLDECDIFSDEYKPVKKKAMKKSQSMSTVVHQHMMEKNKNKPLFQKRETILHPNFDFIKSRTITGPKWKTLKGRIDSFSCNKTNSLPHEENEALHVSDFDQTTKKGFDMSKQTMRSGFPLNDLRVRYEKKYVYDKSYDRPIRKSRSIFSFKQGPLSIKKKSTVKSMLSIRRKSTVKSMLSIRRKSVNNHHDNHHEKKRINAPDFKRTLSREFYNSLNERERFDIPMILPSYEYVRPKPTMMVSYGKETKKKQQRKYSPMDMTFKYDIDKAYKKMKCSGSSSIPKFSKMTSRPCNDGPLPSFMQKLYNRASASIITDQTLKMNNFQNSTYSDVPSYFNVKKSFNRFVNINCINRNENEIEKTLNEESQILHDGNENNDKQKNELERHFRRYFEFYNKNYDELKESNQIEKLDNITLKTYKKEPRFFHDKKEYSSFFIDFSKVDNC